MSLVDKLRHYVGAVITKPTTESFKILQLEFANYDLMLAKVHFLKGVAIDMRIFLTTLQADRPVALFLQDELMSVFEGLAFTCIY